MMTGQAVIRMRRKRKALVLGSGNLNPKKWDWQDFKCDIEDYYE